MFELSFRLALACLLGLVQAGLAIAATQVQGQVIRVDGGDALTLLDVNKAEHKLRLAFIDAPELGQPFGDEAQAALATMVLGRQVTAELRGTVAEEPAQVELVEPRGHVVNLELVRRGLAWVDDFVPQAKAERDRYLSALEEAQRARRGIWALNHVEPPRDHRIRVERLVRIWSYATAFLAAFALLGLLFSHYEERITAWLNKQEEITKSTAEAYRVARIQAVAEQAERDRTREIANAEMNRLAAQRREAERRGKT